MAHTCLTWYGFASAPWRWSLTNSSTLSASLSTDALHLPSVPETRLREDSHHLAIAHAGPSKEMVIVTLLHGILRIS